MRSIRWSLILYFLILLAAALGTIYYTDYGMTKAALEEKEAIHQQVLEQNLQKREAAINDEFDKAIQSYLRVVAGMTQVASRNFPLWHRSTNELSFLVSRVTPTLNFLAPDRFWLRGRTFTDQSLRNLEQFHWPFEFNEDEIFHPPQRAGRGSLHLNANDLYVQINANPLLTGQESPVWHSSSLGDETLPVPEDAFTGPANLQSSFDYVEMKTGQRLVRRVAVETLGFGRRGMPVGPGRAGGQQPPNRGGGPRRDQPERPPATGPARGPLQQPPGPPPPQIPAMFYVQCAAVTKERDDQLQQAREEFEQELEAVREASRTKLGTLRGRFVQVAVGTLAAAIFGGAWLIWFTLAPLRRLSDAVSRVSTKDFRLPFGERRLPVELRPIVQRLTETLELLKRAFAREKQAAADISHELRTPLAALLTTTDVALRKQRTIDEYREMLEDCRASAQQMNQLVERLLSLARLDAGADTMRPREVDAATIAQQCVNLVRPLAEAREISLAVHHDGATDLTTDPDKLREILNNLLHNAIQYNRARGSIDLSVKRENGHVCLEVSDTGIGIAPEAREHVFERFYRADPSRQADKLHAGLGLSIVKGYVDLMGGSISVDSQEGEGTTFRVELPAKGDPETRFDPQSPR